MPLTRIITLFTLICLLGAWLPGIPARAQQAPSIHDYLHQKWTDERGAPRGIWAMAQGKDDFLWIGADTGLYRFDGVSFERIPGLGVERVNEEGVSALLAARNGDLWVGYQSGRIAVLRRGRLIDVTPPQSVIWIWNLVEDARGVVYTATGTRGTAVLRYSGGKWETLDTKLGIPRDNPIAAVFAAPNGRIWLTTGLGIFSFRGDGDQKREVIRFADRRKGLTQPGIAADSRGDVWISSADVGTLPLPATRPAVGFWSLRGIASARKSTVMGNAAFDREDRLWGITGNAGIFSIADPHRHDARRPAIEERFTQADGLSSDSARAVLTDRLGNIWIGTAAGLDRFYKPRIAPAGAIPLRSAYGYAAVNTGSALYAMDADNLYRIDGREKITHLRSGLVNGMAVCGMPDGAIWVSAFSGNLLLAGGKFSPGPQPADRRSILDCAVSRDGRLWVNPVNGGLRYYDGRAWQEGPFRGGKPRMVGPIIAAPEGGILGMLNPGGLFHVDGSHTRLISDLSGIPGRAVTAFHPIGDTVLIAAPPYLARYRQGRLQVLRQDHAWLRGVTGMVDGLDGNLWLFGRAGIVRVALADVDRAFAEPGFRLEARIYGPSDGLIGAPLAGTSHSTASRAPDGSLWFTTEEAILSLDPRALAAKAPAPPVRITRLAYADQALRDPASAVLPPATTRIEIDYTALDLSDPTHLRFQYRLEGVDPSWIVAGGQRRAVYTNLGPGKYRFHVIACNSDGVWNRESAMLDFTVRPTFFQSWLFRLLCVALVLALLVGAYLLRARQITRRLTRSFEDRAAERERIARDLHDTLLQSFQGLIFHIQAAVDKLPARLREQSAIDAALDRTDEVIAEGRERVYDLRHQFGRGDLVESWTATAQSLAMDGKPLFVASVEGAPHALHAIVADEVMLIGDQAIRNAFRHARAARIDARLEYGARGLSLRVRDDGCGIPAELATPAGRAGRLGILGMYERAQRIDGVLQIEPGLSGGTEVQLFVPARIAYRDAAGRVPRWLAGAWRRTFGWRSSSAREIGRTC